MQSIRERLRERRRKRRLHILRLLVCIVLLVSAAVYAWRFIHRPGFAFGDVSINGTSLLTEADVIKMGGSEPPFNIFNVSISRLQDGLAQDIRFRSAEIHYHFPASLQLIVREREPALYVADSYNSYLQVDFDGYVMSVTTGIPDAKAPLLVGAQCGNVYLGDIIKNESVLQILKFLQQIDGEARDRIAEINVDDRNEVRFRQRNSFPILLGPVSGLGDKTKMFMTVFNEIKDKNIRAEYIDLTFTKPYIKLLPEKKK